MRKTIRLTALFVLAAAFGWLSVGCHAQVPPNPTTTTYTCPATTGTLYAALNQASPATGLTYTDSKPAAGTYCYIAQSELGTAVSLPSNTAGPFTTSGSNSVDLTWVAPTTGTAPAGYYISRAPATATVVTENAPTLGAGTVAAIEPSLSPAVATRLPAFTPGVATPSTLLSGKVMQPVGFQ